MKWPWTHTRETAKHALHRAEKNDARVTHAVKQAEILREQNGFGEAIRRAMGGSV